MVKRKTTDNLPSNELVGKFEMIQPILLSIYYEMSELSKKKQDGVLNELKVKMINNILKQVKSILSNEPTKNYLDLLDDDTLPTNSDTVLILANYKVAMNQFKEKYHDYGRIGSAGKWFTKEYPPKMGEKIK